MTTLRGVEDAHDPVGPLVQILPEAVLQQGYLDGVVASCDADAVAESADGFGGISPPPHPGYGGHSRVVPSADHAFLDELEQHPFAHNGVGEVEPGELDLPRVVYIQGV